MPRKARNAGIAFFFLLVTGLWGGALRAAEADLTPEQVRQSIAKGIDFLKQQQRPDGSWPDFMGYPGGVTSLCTLALLNAGVPTDDEAIQRALSYLRKRDLHTTYAVSLQTMVLATAEPRKDLLLISRNVKALERNQITDGPNKGAWSYPGRGNGDNSNSQFALLALHEAERVGVQVNPQTWRLAKAYWEEAQNPDGSWGYLKSNRAGTGSMTCAGISALIITYGKVQEADAKAEGNRIQCCLKSANDHDRIEQGIQWLARNFTVTGNPNTTNLNVARQMWTYYYLYGLERIGRLTARRFIGGHDWYREGTLELIRQQDSLSGFWKGFGHDESNPLISTSWSLLFLAKGRRPILLAKLKHSSGDDWNQHRSDVDHLTRFVESRWKLDLTWQTIDVDSAAVEDLLQAPVVYLCGSESPLPKTANAQRELARKLRDYVDRGGFIFAEAYCNKSEQFNQGFRQLMAQVFPEPEYALRLLEPEHPIWHAEQRIAAEQLRPLWGIEFGCRTSVVYAPPDPPASPRPSLSCLWELSRPGRELKFAPSVQAQIDAGLGIGINVLAYATNRELAPKEETLNIQAVQAPKDSVEYGKLYIAKLRHPGGCNAAPRALLNLLEATGRELKIRVGARDTLLDITDDALFDYHLVFMHGRNGFRFTEAERKQLRTYVERGGTILADSICASQAFTDSFRREMAAIFADRKLEPIPETDPMFTPNYGGFDVKTVARRDPQSAANGGPLKATVRKVPPELEGLKIDNRWGVVFSKYDLSCALEKHDSLECRGYTRQDAARIGLNVILYSLQQ